MLGIPVLQAYGLTETTGICTLDDPGVPVEPGYVGTMISGIEMKIGGERGDRCAWTAHFFRLLDRPEETARVLQDGWFHTGDQGEVNVRGNWRISGRIKNLIILNSGHNIAPEPIEDKIARLLAVGAASRDRRKWARLFVCLGFRCHRNCSAVQSALDAVNPELPHYRQVRKFTIIGDIFPRRTGCSPSTANFAATPSMRDMLRKSVPCTIRKAPARRPASSTRENEKVYWQNIALGMARRRH